VLELLVILEEGLLKLKDNLINDEEEKDLKEDYKVMIREINIKIDPSIRQKLQRGGITVIQNTYTGYDTEYQSHDLKYNELLTVQLAVNTKSLLKLPVVKKYQFTNINPKNGINNVLVQKELNDRIDRLRSLKFQGYDRSMLKIINGLKDLRVPYIENEGKMIFSFDRTPIKTWIKIIDSEGITFNDLVKKSNEIALKDIELE
jgi:hypothetical protein